ncbi:MAG: ADP-ribosylglycohydrolase [Lachnospiraceae bacterium]|nr:ADP-ribosylglycohydrolase [Lachnospiraceae bacterium]
MDFEDAVRSAMLGLVAGDALGVPVEFMSREELERDPVIGMRSQGTHRQPSGTWSDDSSMALCLLESLTEKGVDYGDMMARFLRWADEGYMTARGEVFDMGIATRRALTRFTHGTSPSECGGSGEYDNGNGSLMRILPMALYLHRTMGPDFPQRPEAYPIIHNASALTHAHPVSLISCGIYCAAANELLCGRTGIWDGIKTAKSYYHSQTEFKPYQGIFKRIDGGVLPSLHKSEIRSSGYVVHTLEASLWCMEQNHSFRSCLLEAVNLGEDTDTVGAVAGGLAGLRYGWSEIPSDWLAVIAKRERIERLCAMFSAKVCVEAK